MFSPFNLKTERLVLRPITFADAPSIQRAANVREVADTMISIPYPYPDGEAERYISKQISEFEENRSVTFVIERQFERLFRGIINIREIEQEHSQAELSFWLAVEAQGQGYMSEALKPVIRLGFETLSLNRLYAYHMARNSVSGKVLKKNGFVQEGLLRQRVRKLGVFEDVVLLAILRDGWKEQVV